MMGATVIFCSRGLNRPVPPLNVESHPLQTPIPELGFEPITSCSVASALTTRTRQTNGQESSGSFLQKNLVKNESLKILGAFFCNAFFVCVCVKSQHIFFSHTCEGHGEMHK